MGSFIFVIDTNQYAGNFEREMCAYLCGHVGECGVGEREKAEFDKDFGVTRPDDHDKFPNVVQRPDEHGVARPCAIWPTPGWSNDGMGKHVRLKDGETAKYPAYMSVAIFFKDRPTVGQLAVLRTRAASFIIGHAKLAIDGFRLIEEETTHKEEVLS